MPGGHPTEPVSPSHVALADTVRAKRREKGYSQEAFARRIGVDRRYYHSIEQDYCNVTLATMLSRRTRMQGRHALQQGADLNVRGAAMVGDHTDHTPVAHPIRWPSSPSEGDRKRDRKATTAVLCGPESREHLRNAANTGSARLSVFGGIRPCSRIFADH